MCCRAGIPVARDHGSLWRQALVVCSPKLALQADLSSLGIALLLLHLAAPCIVQASNAAESMVATKGSETGLPIPRFVSLGSERARMRVGLGTGYRIKWIYQRLGLPLEVVAEYGNWRQVRDHEGETGWMHHALLAGHRTAMVAPWGSVAVPLRAAPSFDAAVLARLEPGVVVALDTCGGDWCAISIRDEQLTCHIRQTEVWGAYPGETID